MKILEFREEIKEFDDLFKYFNVYYEQTTNDFAKMEFTTTKIPVRECRQSDFGTSARAIELFESWAGFILACPDLDTASTDSSGKTMKLLADPAAMYSI